ncbi:uncharacterized protein LOC124802921 isoform X2 [Schistocerca piceifrons]|uniref:uncharacterized protein LOC124802921 isoform X2 n=1 Tax=Schistocerca piceifrons TaxID=274613 RepID=UPI001F5EE2E2|nr:uncharacterized protein LOC124802921 isoform X2 [Schistocerca piceifrons]
MSHVQIVSSIYSSPFQARVLQCYRIRSNGWSKAVCTDSGDVGGDAGCPNDDDRPSRRPEHHDHHDHNRGIGADRPRPGWSRWRTRRDRRRPRWRGHHTRKPGGGSPICFISPQPGQEDTFIGTG